MEKESFNRHLKLLQNIYKIFYSREKKEIFRVDLKESLILMIGLGYYKKLTIGE